MKLPEVAQGEFSSYLGWRYATGPLVLFSLLLVLLFSCSKEKSPSNQAKELGTQMVERTTKKTNTTIQAKEYYNRGVFYQE